MTRRLSRAAGYIRVSSGKQERSPAQLKSEIRKLAKAASCGTLSIAGASAGASKARIGITQPRPGRLSPRRVGGAVRADRPNGGRNLFINPAFSDMLRHPHVQNPLVPRADALFAQ